jgi:hypothetical protein
MAVCSFAHCEAALSLQAAYSDYQIGAFENFHQPVEDTLMVLRPGRKVVFQYELCFVNRLKSQLLISHLFLPIKKMPPGKGEEARNQAAFWKYPHFFELSDQFLFQCEKPSAHDRGGFLGRVLIKRECQPWRPSGSVIALPLTHSAPQSQRQHHGRLYLYVLIQFHAGIYSS